jgi:hypothetical protein
MKEPLFLNRFKSLTLRLIAKTKVRDKVTFQNLYDAIGAGKGTVLQRTSNRIFHSLHNNVEVFTYGPSWIPD